MKIKLLSKCTYRKDINFTYLRQGTLVQWYSLCILHHEWGKQMRVIIVYGKMCAFEIRRMAIKIIASVFIAVTERTRVLSR